MVYDWCFASVSANQRARWLAYADQAVWNVWHPDDATWAGKPADWSGWSIDNPSNNYYYSFLRATMLLGLGAEGELASAAGWKAFFRTTKIQQQLVPTFESDLVGGGSREGTGYGTAMMRLWEVYDIWEESTGENIALLTGHSRASLVQFMHTVVPTLDAVSLNGDHSRDSTGALFDYHRHYAQSLAKVVGDTALSGRVRSLFDASSVPQMQNGFMLVHDFLYDMTAVPTQPLSALNTVYRGAGHRPDLRPLRLVADGDVVERHGRPVHRVARASRPGLVPAVPRRVDGDRPELLLALRHPPGGGAAQPRAHRRQRRRHRHPARRHHVDAAGAAAGSGLAARRRRLDRGVHGAHRARPCSGCSASGCTSHPTCSWCSTGSPPRPAPPSAGS